MPTPTHRAPQCPPSHAGGLGDEIGNRSLSYGAACRRASVWHRCVGGRGTRVYFTAPTPPDAFYQWGDTTCHSPNSQNLVAVSHLNVSQRLSRVCAVPIGTLSNCAHRRWSAANHAAPTAAVSWLLQPRRTVHRETKKSVETQGSRAHPVSNKRVALGGPGPGRRPAISPHEGIRHPRRVAHHASLQMAAHVASTP